MDSPSADSRSRVGPRPTRLALFSLGAPIRGSVLGQSLPGRGSPTIPCAGFADERAGAPACEDLAAARAPLRLRAVASLFRRGIWSGRSGSTSSVRARSERPVRRHERAQRRARGTVQTACFRSVFPSREEREVRTSMHGGVGIAPRLRAWRSGSRREPRDHGSSGAASSLSVASPLLTVRAASPRGVSLRGSVTGKRIRGARSRLDFDLASERRRRRGNGSTMASFFALRRFRALGGGLTSQIPHEVTGRASRCGALLPLVTSHSRQNGSQPDRISSVLLNAGRAPTAARSPFELMRGVFGLMSQLTLMSEVTRPMMRLRLGPSGEAGARPSKECQKNLVHQFHAPGNVWWGRLQYGREIASEQ